MDLEYLSIPRDHFEKLVTLTAESVQGTSTALLVGNARDKPGFPKAKDDASLVSEVGREPSENYGSLESTSGDSFLLL